MAWYLIGLGGCGVIVAAWISWGPRWPPLRPNLVLRSGCALVVLLGALFVIQIGLLVYQATVLERQACQTHVSSQPARRLI